MTVNENNPRIYVACLSSYNNGYQHGRWIKASTDIEAMQEEIAEMLATSPMAQVEPCEEWVIHDYENFKGLPVGEYTVLEAIAKHVSYIGICKAMYVPVEVVTEVYAGDVEELDDWLSERFQGKYDSAEDYAEEYINECTDLSGLPDIVRYHIDYKGIARDMSLGGDVQFIECDGDVYVFNGY